MHCKASHASCDQLSTNQRNVSEITFGAGTTKINLKIWKAGYERMTWCKKQSAGIKYIVMEDFDLWQILAKVLLQLITSKH